MKTEIEMRLQEAFANIVKKHNNGKWAYEELDYLVFVKNYESFSRLSEQEQWNVREYMSSLKKIFC